MADEIIKSSDEKYEALMEGLSYTPELKSKSDTPNLSDNSDVGYVESRRLPYVKTLTDEATIAVNVFRGDTFKITLGGNRTLGNPTNPQGDRQRIEFIVKQDGTGGRTLAYDTKYRFSTGLPSPTITTTANHFDVLIFAYHKDDDKWDFIGYVPDFT
jgi:hypothetical protein